MPCIEVNMQKKYFLSLLLTTALWGTTFSFAKKLLLKITPIAYTSLILLFGLVFLFTCLIKKRQVPDLKVAWRTNPRLVAVIGFVILPSALLVQFFVASSPLSSSIDLTIIRNLQALFVMMINVLVFKAKIRKLVWIGAVVAFAGVYFVMLGRGPAVYDQYTYIADLMGVVIGGIWAIYTAFGKRIVEKCNPLAATALLFSLGFVVTGSLWMIEGSIASMVSLTWIEWLMLAFIGTCSMGLGYWLWYEACSVVPSEKVALFVYISPLTAILLGVLWLGETFTLVTFFGFVLTIAGLYLAEREKFRRESSPTCGLVVEP
jgi:drug/metabolite transporter (DMT)-like permease